MIEHITERLFSVTPQSTLYHYSSLAGVLGIVSSGELRASDIRYMNDSAELRHTLDVLRNYITRRVPVVSNFRWENVSTTCLSKRR
tara:strand:+ start:9611 stop:9868 length:258 start_codon:yes stop_codon:yes gene_type:complete